MALALVAVLLIACVAGCGAKTSAVKVINLPLTDEQYAFGVTKNDAALLTSVNAFIAEIKQNGKFDEILDKYFGDGTPTAVVSAPQAPPAFPAD